MANLLKLVEHALEFIERRAIVEHATRLRSARQPGDIPHGMLAHAHDVATFTLLEKACVTTRHLDAIERRWFWGLFFSFKSSLHLLEDPRVPLGGTCNHHGVATGLAHHRNSISATFYVTVSNYGNAYGLFDTADDTTV